MNRKKLSVNGKQKIKMKKNAMDFVNFEEEKRKDPKFKTELCKSWIETRFCVYGNKCRFAHGRHELFCKFPATNYKKKSCKSFNEQGICLYGARCNFRHDERKIDDISLPYYYIGLFIKNDLHCIKRLKVFEDITDGTMNENCSVSTLSNDDIDPSANDYNSIPRKDIDEMEFPFNTILSFMM